MSAKQFREGYFMVDHRDSPGTRAVPGGTLFESGTITCAHCTKVVVLNPRRTRARGYCGKCDHYVCDDPICNNGCDPVMRQVELAFEQLLRKVG